MFFLSSEGHNFVAGGEEFYLLSENIQGIYVSKSFYQLESEKNILVNSLVNHLGHNGFMSLNHN